MLKIINRIKIQLYVRIYVYIVFKSHIIDCTQNKPSIYRDSIYPCFPFTVPNIFPANDCFYIHIVYTNVNQGSIYRCGEQKNSPVHLFPEFVIITGISIRTSQVSHIDDEGGKLACRVTTYHIPWSWNMLMNRFTV